MRVETITNDKGKKCIKRVPIFKLGIIRGFAYDAAWAERAKTRMQELAAGDYYPPIIIGHNGLSSEIAEKEALGFMKNIDYVLDPGNTTDDPRGTFYADMDDLSDYGEYVIKEKKYPSRSVEIQNERAEFSALALLGGTAPHFKFPQLELYKQAGGGEVFSCPDEILEFEEQSGAFKQFIDKLAEGIRAAFRSANPDQPPTPTTKTAQEAEMTDAEFKAKYGMTPDEMVTRMKEMDSGFVTKYGMTPDQMVTKLREQETQLADMQKTGLETAMTKFKTDLQGFAVSKAEQDSMIALVETHTGDKLALIAQLTGFAEKAAAGKLIVPLDETGGNPERKGKLDTSDDNAIYAEIKAYQAKNNCTFEEAKKAVFKQIKEA